MSVRTEMNQPAAAPPKYRLLAELGHGGMADVYVAVLRGPTGFTKLAVVKRLRSHLAEDPEFLAMFLQEARIAARLSHPNVVHTFEVGHDGKHSFIAMEYLQGHPLSALIARVGREKLDFAMQLRILVEVLEGLQYAHDLRDFDGKPMGLVHRDVSPQNVFITYDGQVKLLDFGIAKAMDSAVETRTGVIKGKLSYMSPEQALGGDVDRRSDLYSVGVILWEMIAQRRRWKGLSNVQMMKKLVGTDEPLELPDPAAQGLPESLSKILERALARKPEERYSQASELQADLEKVLEEMGRRVSARDVGKLVADLFKADQVRIQSVIEAELKRMEAEEAKASAATVARVGSSGLNLARIDLPPMSQSASSLTLESPAATDQSAALSLRPDEQQKRRRSVWTALAVFALLGVVTGALLSRPYWGAAPAPAVTAEATPAPAATEISVKLAAQPQSATLYLDDKKLDENPYTAKLARSTKTAIVRAESPGHETQTRAIDLSNDVDVTFELKQVEATPAASESAAEAKPKPRVTWRRGSVAPKTTATAEPPVAKTEPAKPEPPKMQAPPKPKPGVSLDEGNPWAK